MKFYKVIELPTLLYRSESWTHKARGINRMQSVEMKYIRTVQGFTRLGCIKNKHITKVLKIQQIQNKTDEHT